MAPPDPKDQAAIREARRLLQDRVRNDWHFSYSSSAPHVSAVAEASSTLPTSPAVGALTLDEEGDDLPDRPFLEWRERNYASSDPSSEAESSAPLSPPPASERSPKKPELQLRRKRDFFFGHSRDTSNGSSGAADLAGSEASAADEATRALERRKQDRKRRRRRRLDDEMQWNEGLRFWQARRDAWCCAKSEPMTEPLSPTSSLSASSGSVSKASAGAGDDTKMSLPHDADSGHASAEREDHPPLKRSVTSTTLLPVAPPLIPPSDPSAVRITPALYPSIYSKVVLQSLTPAVPINLSNIIGSLVDGWKRDGEWPPKMGVSAVHSPRPSDGLSAKGRKLLERTTKKEERERADGENTHFGLRSGMARVKRGLRISLSGGSGTGTGTGDDKPVAPS